MGKDVAENLKRIADASMYADGTDTPLAEQVRAGATEIEKLRSQLVKRQYPHMCRDQHIEIGHRDSGDDERCPLCRALDGLERIAQVCLDNEGPNVSHDLALRFVKDVAAKTAASLTLSDDQHEKSK